MTKRSDLWVVRENLSPPLYHAYFKGSPQGDDWDFLHDVPKSRADSYKEELASFKRIVAKYPGYMISFELVEHKGVVVFEISDQTRRTLNHEEQVAWCVENKLKVFKVYYCGPWNLDIINKLEEEHRPVMIYAHG